MKKFRDRNWQRAQRKRVCLFAALVNMFAAYVLCLIFVFQGAACQRKSSKKSALQEARPSSEQHFLHHHNVISGLILVEVMFGP